MKVLAVIPDVTLAAALEARFRKRFADDLVFHVADSALHARTMLEHDAPDLMISAGHVGDMSGLELLETVRGDTSLAEVAFILLDGAAKGFHTSRLEVVLESHAHPADVLEAAFDLLIASGYLEDSAPQPIYGSLPPAAAKRRSARAKMSGTLEVLTLFDLVLSLTQKRNSGKLYVLLGDVEALLVFQGGRFVHAEYAGLVGEEAVMRIFLGSETYQNAEFYFEPVASKLPPSGVTLHASVQELLLKVAIELDHHREALSLST